MSDCVFCRIVAGELPCTRVYEDDQSLAFLDIRPLQHGHTLLIPKQHYECMTDLPAPLAAAMGRVLPNLARAVAAATKAEGFNILQQNGTCAGQVVPHLHIHIVPRHPGDGLGFRWNAGAYAEGQMAEMGARIAAALRG